jgi:5-methylcytosine-specific restriction endonuclease McrA
MNNTQTTQLKQGRGADAPICAACGYRKFWFSFGQTWECIQCQTIAAQDLFKKRMEKDRLAYTDQTTGRVIYQKYLKSEAWWQLRQSKLREVEWKCERCGDHLGDVQIHIHHKTYETLGNESLWDIEALCATCHASEHFHQ